MDSDDLKPSSPAKPNSKARQPPRKTTKKDDSEVLTPDKVRNIIKEEIREAMSGVNAALTDLRLEMSGLQEAVKFVTENYDQVKKRIENIEVQQKSISKLETDISELKNEIRVLKQGVQKQEQWGRRSNVEIVGLPERTNENLVELMSRLAKLANCPLNPDTDIDFVTRVAHKSKDQKKPKPVIVRFLARYKKDNFLARLRAIKNFKASDIGFTGNSSRIFFNEHLSVTNKILLSDTKRIASEKHYKYVWVKNQSIMVRKNDTSDAIHIASENDLKKMV